MISKTRFKGVFTLGRLLLPLLTLGLQQHAFPQGIDWTKELKNWNGKTVRIIMIQDPWVKAFDTIDREFEKLTGAKVSPRKQCEVWQRFAGKWKRAGRLRIAQELGLCRFRPPLAVASQWRRCGMSVPSSVY